MCYTTNVVYYMANASMELSVHMIYPGPEHWKALVLFIGYLKGKDTKGITIRNTKVLKAVMFCDSSYATDKDVRKTVSDLVTTLGGTLLTCSSKNQRTVTLSSMEAELVVLSACAQALKFLSMLLVEMTEVKKPSVIYEDNQGAIFLAEIRQVGTCTKHIDVCHNFLRDMVKEKDIDIQYIWSEDNPADIMTKNTSEANFARHMKRVQRGRTLGTRGYWK